MTDTVNLLRDLSNAIGPSGFEGPVRKIMERELDPVVDHLETDGIGSLIATKNGPQGAPRVMLCAHMDEVGLMVRYITDDGFIKFQTLGGWLDQALIGQRWNILTRKGLVNGITGIKTPHVMSADDRLKVFKKEDIFIDVGSKSREDAEGRLNIRPGDPIAPDSSFCRLNDSDFLLGKAWDDRAGLGILVQLMDRIKNKTMPCSVYAVSTVQEEIGLRGAHTSSYKVAPDIGINLEAGVASDYPGITKEEAQESLGFGPTVFLHDSSMLPNLKLRDLVEQTALELSIPLQFNVLNGYGQDGAEMQRSHTGVPAVNISVPTRYLHSHNSLISKQDFDYTVDLVTALVRRLDHDTIAEVLRFN